MAKEDVAAISNEGVFDWVLYKEVAISFLFSNKIVRFINFGADKARFICENAPHASLPGSFIVPWRRLPCIPIYCLILLLVMLMRKAIRR